MLKFFCSLPNLAWAAFIARWIFAIVTLVKGWYKVFEMGIPAHISIFTDGYAEFWFLPRPLLWLAGASIPIIEIIAGVLLLLGWRTREALVSMGLILIVTTFGHTLKEPFFDIGDGQTLGYLVLILFLLSPPKGSDRLGADYWLEARG